MLYPTIELEEKHTYCTCGAPNFRSVSEWNKPIKRIFKLTLPKAPCGNTMHYLCEDCLKKIRAGGIDTGCVFFTKLKDMRAAIVRSALKR